MPRSVHSLGGLLGYLQQTALVMTTSHGPQWSLRLDSRSSTVATPATSAAHCVARLRSLTRLSTEVASTGPATTTVTPARRFFPAIPTECPTMPLSDPSDHAALR